MDRLEIFTSKKKSILLLIVSVLFVVLGIWLLSSAEQLADARNRSALFIQIIGAASILFFGLGIIVFLLRIIKSEMALVVDAKGIHINPKKASSAIIRWSDILDFEEIKINSTPIVIVHVRDPESWVEKEKNALRRQLMKVNINQYQSPFNIAAAGLNISHSQLLESLNTYHKNFRLQIIK